MVALCLLVTTCSAASGECVHVRACSHANRPILMMYCFKYEYRKIYGVIVLYLTLK